MTMAISRRPIAGNIATTIGPRRVCALVTLAHRFASIPERYARFAAAVLAAAILCLRMMVKPLVQWDCWNPATSYWDTLFGLLEFCGWLPA
jgi:hypothetical protein